MNMNISLPDALKDFVDEQGQAGLRDEQRMRAR